MYLCVCCRIGRVQLFVNLWTIACQASLFMRFSRQEYWSGLPGPPPGDLPEPGIEPESLVSPALAGGFFTTRATWEAICVYSFLKIFFSIIVYHRILNIVPCDIQ